MNHNEALFPKTFRPSIKTLIFLLRNQFQSFWSACVPFSPFFFYFLVMSIEFSNFVLVIFVTNNNNTDKPQRHKTKKLRFFSFLAFNSNNLLLLFGLFLNKSSCGCNFEKSRDFRTSLETKNDKKK